MPLRPVKATLQAVLAQAVATLTAEGIPLPARQYVAAGGGQEDVPWDCEQLVVVPVQVRPGSVSQAGPGPSQLVRQRGGGALVRTLDLQVQLVRSHPKPGPRGQPPSEEALAAAGEQLADDLAGLVAVIDACAVDAAVGERTMIAPGTVAAVGPLGDMVAAVGALSVTLMAGPGA